MKRLLFGLFAAGVALSMSAFTTFTPKNKLMTFYYVLTTAGFYQRVSFVPDGDNCLGTAANKCYLGYSSDQGQSFSINSIPAAPSIQSATFGLYIP
ncbi:hypothetical protein DBR11_07525 [Pedobacter sp. HMWF019]|uniref:hypothetical protein n=1 Tax=Pedobacter sp. HMWF019 TaxID=2056856 RepID=UPI000D35A3FD|nr:hypothetical protein [Pedobacter sp. HMWF019]PTT01391.1 hypothetical protein DBR11_07525 [Pedobacter sp. HMWF019]